MLSGVVQGPAEGYVCFNRILLNVAYCEIKLGEMRSTFPRN